MWCKVYSLALAFLISSNALECFAHYYFVYHKRTNKSLTFSAIVLHEIFLVDVQVIPLKATPHAAWALSWVQSPRRWEMLSIVPHRSKEKIKSILNRLPLFVIRMNLHPVFTILVFVWFINTS